MHEPARRADLVRSLRQGIAGTIDPDLRARLATDEGDHRAVARALLAALVARDDAGLTAPRAEPRAAEIPGARTSFVPVPQDADGSFLGHLKTRSDVAGEQSVASMSDVPTLLAVLRAGSLLQRRAAARRLAARLGDPDLAVEDWRAVIETFGTLRDVELAYDLLACHAVLPGEASREATETRREVREMATRLTREVLDYWEGDVEAEPLMRLSGDARTQLMLHARDLDDVLLWHVCALVEEACGPSDLANQRALLSSLRYASDPRLVPSLASVLASGAGPLVIEAARAISRIEDPRVWPALVDAYERSVIEAEHIALGAALGRVGDVRAADYVRSQLASEDEAVKVRALEALRTVGSADDVPAVLAIARAKDPVLASKAAHTLGRISDGRGLADLARLAASAEVGSVRAAAEEAVAQIGARLVLRGEEPTGVDLPVSSADVTQTLAPANLTFGERVRALRLYLTGRLWLVLGATERALARFEDAAQSRPDWSLPLIVAATLYAARDDFVQALALFRRALSLSRVRIEQSPPLIRHVARCFLRRAEQLERDGRLAIARGLLDEVLRLDLRRVPSSLRFEIGRRHETLRLMGGG
ncbi:MAG: HEAT repeat domain-containing protein [Polyangiales bacterium]